MRLVARVCTYGKGENGAKVDGIARRGVFNALYYTSSEEDNATSYRLCSNQLLNLFERLR